MGTGDSGLCGMSRCTGWKIFTPILKDCSTFAFTFLQLSFKKTEYPRRTPLWEHGTAYPNTIWQMLLFKYTALDLVNSYRSQIMRADKKIRQRENLFWELYISQVWKPSEFEWKICNFLSVLLFPRITMQCSVKVITHNNSSFIVDILWFYFITTNACVT